MCWSGEASAAIAAVGVLSTGYAAYKKEPRALWICLGYFSLMEILQAYTYSVIGQCGNPANQMATLLGYLHIAFQPFFINAVSMHFIDRRKARKIAPLVYTLCFASAVMLLLKLYPFAWAAPCNAIPLCGKELCSMHGNWHIAWSLPLTTVGEKAHMYALAAFVAPLLYGSWRFTLYHAVMGPLLAMATTSNMNEWPAVWCLFSIGFLLVVIKTPLRGLLYVDRGPLWGRRPPQPVVDRHAEADFGNGGNGNARQS
ncbi:MAG: DUF5765 domain-containing protein [Alphaproteobacteria bacterium]